MGHERDQRHLLVLTPHPQTHKAPAVLEWQLHPQKCLGTGAQLNLWSSSDNEIPSRNWKVLELDVPSWDLVQAHSQEKGTLDRAAEKHRPGCVVWVQTAQPSHHSSISTFPRLLLLHYPLCKKIYI